MTEPQIIEINAGGEITRLLHAMRDAQREAEGIASGIADLEAELGVEPEAPAPSVFRRAVLALRSLREQRDGIAMEAGGRLAAAGMEMERAGLSPAVVIGGVKANDNALIRAVQAAVLTTAYYVDYLLSRGWRRSPDGAWQEPECADQTHHSTAGAVHVQQARDLKGAEFVLGMLKREP